MSKSRCGEEHGNVSKRTTILADVVGLSSGSQLPSGLSHAKRLKC